MIVVSDTSPIRALGNLGLLALLRQLYQTVVIPRAVALELSRAPTGQFSVEVDEFGPSIGVQIASAKDMALVEKFLTELDPGESEALALAIELNADVVLIDETAGRPAARRHGLEVIGVLDILLEAKHRGLIDSLAPLIDRLQFNHQFFISAEIRRQILRAAGE